MSHSDSEINKPRGEFRKKLHVEFKAKNLGKGLTNSQYVALRRKIRILNDARLICASATNNVAGLEKQLELGACPDSADMHGRSALHIAASKGYADIVRSLLENGADPNQKDNLCNTPLHLAACTHNLEVIGLLLKAGADVRKLDWYGKTPLQLVCSRLKLLQSNWRQGSVDMIRVRMELHTILDIMIQVAKKNAESNVELQMMKLSINSDRNNNVDDQMSKLLMELEGVKIS